MIERIAELLKQRMGLEVDSIGQVVLERAVHQRRLHNGLSDNEAYWTKISTCPHEQQALIEAVVVGETWFFRYPESFVALQQVAFEQVKQLAAGKVLRILSLPCSTGEEPYSVVMALLDAGLAPSLFQVDALDISEHALQVARKGWFGRNSFRGQSLAFRDRHFLPSEAGFSLSETVRSKVRFLRGNLLEHNFLAQEAPYDFVFCRNLLIYFDRPTQMQVLSLLQRLTVENGLLFVGPAEANLLSQLGLRSLGMEQSFAFRKTSSQIANSAASVRVPARRVQTPVPLAKPRTPDKPSTQPRPLLKAPPVMAEPSTAASALSLQQVQQLADQGQTRQALALAERLQREQEPSAALFYWLGLLHEVLGNSDSAHGFYRKVLYIDPQHPEALAHLATLLVARGDLLAAQRLQQRAGRGVKHNDQP